MGKMITAFELKAMLAEYPAKAVAEKRQFNFSLGGNVNLTIYKSGNNAFFARVKNETLRLGTYPEMSLSEARKRVKEFAGKAKRGNEGGSQHRDAGSGERDSLTVGGMYEKFLDQYKGTGKNDKRYFNLRSYAKYLAPFGNKPLSVVMPADVISGLKKFKLSANYSAAVFQGIKQSFDCAVLFGYLDRNPLSGFGRSRLNPFKRVPTGGFAWVRAEDLKTAFFAPLDSMPFVYRGLVLFAALSCCRIGEAQRLKWEWINPDQGVITVPGEFTKTGKEHEIPITRQIFAFLENWEKATLFDRQGFLFRSQPHMETPISKSPLQVVIHACLQGKATVHGLRKSASTWMHEQGYGDIAERCLSHVVGTAVSRTYDHASYYKEKLTCLQAWNDYLDQNCLSQGFECLL